MPGAVVNGGLIDFQDNLQRGVQEYVSPSMLLQATSGVGPNGMGMICGLPGALPGSIAAQQGFVQQGGAFPVGGNVSSSILCGPASFLHVNGVTYKPVEEPNSKLSAQDSVRGASSPSGAQSVDAGEPAPRMLSKRELQQAIDERVKSQVRSYIRNQQADVDEDCSSGADGRVAMREVCSPEELAARRVANLNADMTGSRGKGRSLQSHW